MRKWLWAALFLILAAALFSAALAQTGQFDLPWHTIDGGGGASDGGPFSLVSSVGQPDAATLSGGDFTLSGGFLVPAVAPASQDHSVFLPFVTNP